MRSVKHVVLMAMLGLVILFAPAGNKASAQAKFATPDEAAVALHQALKAENLEQMQAIFGREWMEAAASGDPVPTSMIAKWLRSRWSSPGVGRRAVRTPRN